METTKTLVSRQGSDSLALAFSAASEHVRISHRYTDDFDGDEDSWATLGEFRVQDIIDALVPPTTATLHVANLEPSSPRRRFWRRK